MRVHSRRSAMSGAVSVQGSKSHTIRAVMCAALAEGTSTITNPLTSGDAKSALAAVQCLGAKVKMTDDGRWVVTGVNGRPTVPENFIDTGNSGTTTYFVASIAALAEGYVFLTGDYQIRRRSIDELVAALCELGADVHMTRPGSKCPPVVIHGPRRAGVAHLSGFNAPQVSGLLVSSPFVEGVTDILISDPREKPYLKMTLDWMRRYGAVAEDVKGDCSHFRVAGGQRYRACDSMIPADWSSAAFPLAAAVVTPSELVINGVDFGDVQGDKAVVDHLIAMGADIEKHPERFSMTVRGGKPLTRSLTIDLNDTPDALPALSVIAAYANADTTFTGLAHVRTKETDRVAVMQEELGKMGADIEAGENYLTVHGGKPLRGAEIESHDDHRVAMAMSIAGMFADGITTVKNAECCSISFPGFYEDLRAVGADFFIE